MTASAKFQKALMLLDRGRTREAVESLRLAISQAEQERDQVTEVGARCALGDVLSNEGNAAEARTMLEKVVATKRDDDVLAYEIKRARELLTKLPPP